jgi:hypothetical protein
VQQEIQKTDVARGPAIWIRPACGVVTLGDALLSALLRRCSVAGGGGWRWRENGSAGETGKWDDEQRRSSSDGDTQVRTGQRHALLRSSQWWGRSKQRAAVQMRCGEE